MFVGRLAGWKPGNSCFVKKRRERLLELHKSDTVGTTPSLYISAGLYCLIWLQREEGDFNINPHGSRLFLLLLFAAISAGPSFSLSQYIYSSISLYIYNVVKDCIGSLIHKKKKKRFSKMIRR